AGLMACLSPGRDIEVVAELDRRDRVLPTVFALRPDVAVLDDGIACPDGFALVHALHTITPSCHTLIMATRPHPRDLRQATCQVATGMKALDPDLAFATLDTPANPMTPRECDVLRLAAAGAPTAEIAGKLCLAIGTVRNHISATITKTAAP